MVNFKEIDGKLCMMLEEPIPYMGFTKPVVIGLKHDYCEHKFIADDEFTNIDTLCQNFKIMFYNMFHVYGYPVEEGSAEWALYQMLIGHKVCRKTWKRNMYCYATPDMHSNDYLIFTKDVDSNIDIQVQPSDKWMEFLKHEGSDTGWQLYEPKPKPCPVCNGTVVVSQETAKDESQTPLPVSDAIQIKVGDWVRCKSGHDYEITSYPSKLLPSNPNVYDAILTSCMDCPLVCLELSDIARKLQPSEVVIQIGCLRGVVRPVSTNGIHIWFHLVNNKDEVAATIRLTDLDPQTRQLVESLLKAQQKEIKE